MAQRGSSDGWEYSTEGDLDPDLTEEAGYAWEPPGRRWGGLALKAILVVVLIAMLAGMLLPLL